MPRKNNPVCLSPEEITTLKSLTHKGAGKSARTIMHAHILLLTADNQPDKKKNIREVAELFDISPTTSQSSKENICGKRIGGSIK